MDSPMPDGDKRRVTFLLGAGASKDACLPLSEQLGREIDRRLSDSSAEESQAYADVAKDCKNIDEVFDRLRRTDYPVLLSRVSEVLREILWLPASRRGYTEYLARILDLAAQQDDPFVFTLNYDNCVELACEGKYRLNFHVCDHPGEQKNDLREINYIKMHGSLDWCFIRAWGMAPKGATLYDDGVQRISPRSMTRSGFSKAIFVGGREYHADVRNGNRDLYRLHRLFVDTLDQTDVLFAVGYSFNDRDLNGDINAWFGRESAVERRLIIVNSMERNKFRAETPFINRLWSLQKDVDRIRYMRKRLIEVTAQELVAWIER
jgi:hypothetical protein